MGAGGSAEGAVTTDEVGDKADLADFGGAGGLELARALRAGAISSS
jgi:hypothetical protein